MSLQDWVEMLSHKWQTKEKAKVGEKVKTAEATGPIVEQPEVVVRATGDGLGQAEDAEEAVEPLMRKRRRLVNTVQAEAMQGGTVAEAAEPSRERGEQGGVAVGDEGQEVLLLVIVPFEATPEEEQRARRKQAANAARVKGRNIVHDVLCAEPRRLGQVELTRGETSGASAGHSEEEASDGS